MLDFKEVLTNRQTTADNQVMDSKCSDALKINHVIGGSWGVVGAGPIFSF